jgi:hypothetical protein
VTVTRCDPLKPIRRNGEYSLAILACHDMFPNVLLIMVTQQVKERFLHERGCGKTLSLVNISTQSELDALHRTPIRKDLYCGASPLSVLPSFAFLRSSFRLMKRSYRS